MNVNNPSARVNRQLPAVAAALSLLLIPAIAMLFSAEVDWDLRDFVIMGVLLSGTALAAEFAWRKAPTLGWRLLYVAAAVIAFLLVWAELAVGVFGTPFAGS